MPKKPSSPKQPDGNARSVKPPSPKLTAMMEEDAGLGIGPEEPEPVADDTPFYGPAFGITVLERLLLAIIDANKADGTRRGRLDRALRALIDRKSLPAPLPRAPGQFRPKNDELEDRALLWMGEQWAMATGERPSAASLAKKAAEKFFPSVKAQQVAVRAEGLAARFTGSYQKKLATYVERDELRTFAYRATRHDYIRESVEMQTIRRVCADLANAGVHVSLADD